MDIPELCDALERYFDALQAGKVAGLWLSDEVLLPQGPAALARAEGALGGAFPEDVRRFLARGFRGQLGFHSEPFASVGFPFLDPAGIVAHTTMLRSVAKEALEEGSSLDHAAAIARGFALTGNEPDLVVNADGVFHFSFRNPLLRVAGSWQEFLGHWLASGAFASHSFDSHWAKVKGYAGASGVLYNDWISAYKRQFPTI